MERFRLNTTNHSIIPTEAILSVQDYLTHFALSENFLEQIEIAFGNRFDPNKLEELRQQWATGHFEALPEIEIRPAAEINGAIGAFSADTNTIYLSREYIVQNAFHAQAIANIVVEEIGHFVDSQINISDASGDEGAIFSALVQGIELNKQKLQSLKSEDDTADLTLNGETLQIEQATEIKRPLLIVPGIGGTFGKDFNPEWYVNRGVKPDQLVIDPIGGVYDDLIQTLKNVGYEEGKNLFVANYDWRLPVGPQDGVIDGKIAGLTAEKITDDTLENGVDYLGYWLQQAAESWEKQFGIGKSPESVDVITHSTGGLITRAYIQSDAYGGSFPSASGSLTLPEVNNFFMIGVPNRGASQAWNPLHNNWIRKDGFLNTLPDRLVLSKIVNRAYQKVLAGETIIGSIGSEPLALGISLETIKNPLTGEYDPVRFISQYLPSLRDLLATYNFIDLGFGLTNINGNPNEKNSLLLDLNSGADLLQPPFLVDPSPFAEKSKVIAIYGTNENTETTVTEKIGALSQFSGEILPFTDFAARKAKDNEVWYQTNTRDENGDATVPLESSFGFFDFGSLGRDERIQLEPFTTKKVNFAEEEAGKYNTKDTITHLDLMSNVDVQKLILKTLDRPFQESQISDELQLTSFESFIIATTKLDIFNLGFNSSPDSESQTFQLNAPQTASSLGSDNEVFQLNALQALGSFTDSNSPETFLTQLTALITGKFEKDGVNLPMIGDRLKNLDFLSQIGLEDINDITFDKAIPDEVKVTLKFNKQLDKFDIPISGDFGLPGLDLNVDGNTQLDVGLNFALSFGINKSKGFFIDTSIPDELRIDLKASIPDLTATGKLGFLQLKVKDEDADSIVGNGGIDVDGDGVKPTNLTASFAINISGDLDNGLSVDKPTLTGSGNVNLRLDTSFDGSVKLPQIGTDLVLNWKDFKDLTPDEFKFNNVTLGLGSFFTGFASPIIDKIQTVTKPVQPVLDILTTPIDFKVAKADLLGVGRKLGVIDESDENFIRSLKQLKELADNIKKGGNTSLSLGSVDLTDRGDITQPDFASKVTLDKQPVDVVAELEKIKTAAKTEVEKAEVEKAKTAVSGFKSVPGAGLEFPILTDPTTAVNLLLGKDVNLFTYDLPQLGFEFNYDQFFPVIGPLGVRLGGSVGANVDLDFGYDAFGLKQFSQSKDVNDIFNGFFASDRKPPTESGEDRAEATLNAGITASASVEGGIVRGDAGGKIDGNIYLDLNDPSNPNDGKIRANEISELLDCPFDVSGKLSAGLFAKLKVGFGPFSYTKRFNFVNKTLLSFEAGCDTAVSHKPNKDNLGLAQEDPLGSSILRLNMGPHASARKTGGQAGKDEEEIFAVQAGTETGTVDVSAFNITEPYKKVTQITAEGGQQDDTIETGEGVLISTFIRGGNGNDQLFGGSGKDILEGNANDDALFGGSGDDSLLGGEGEDYLEGGSGADILEGGSDSDTVSYKDSPVGVRFSIDPSDSNFFIGSGGDAQGDQLKNIEHIEGSNSTNSGDRLLGNNSNNTLEGLRGNDVLEGGEGDDILLGGAGADRLDGGSGRDWTGYIASPAEVSVNLATGKAFSGDAEGDQLRSIEDVKGSIYSDILIGSNFANYLDGFFGDDRIVGDSGADTLDGGGIRSNDFSKNNPGKDWVSYETSLDGVNISLRTGNGSGGDAQADKLIRAKDEEGKDTAYNSFENLEGSLGNDALLEGDLGDNIIKGLDGKDTLKGDKGDDTLIGGSTADDLDGGDGIDWADYSDSPAAVTVNLQFGSGSGGDAQGDTFVRSRDRSTTENLLGSNFVDTFFGDDGDNEINPGLSNSQNNEFDVVGGGAGNDLLTLNYSFNDMGTGVFGGFTDSYIGFGPGLGFFRKTRDQSHFLDAVSFDNIERLKIIGTLQADTIWGGTGDDILLPGNGDDTIFGGTGSNTINADDGNDKVVDQDVNGAFLQTSPAKSVIHLDGGQGIDTLSVDLSGQRNASVSYPENIVDIVLESTSPFQENSNQQLLLPDGGIITKFEIFKNIKTDDGSDTLTQLGRIDNDFSTGISDDTVNPGLGFDVVDGGFEDGSGNDLLILDYSVEDTGTGMSVVMPSNTADKGYYYRYDNDGKLLDQVTFSNFERFEVTGTRKSDRLIGRYGADILKGQDGNDTIFGGLDNDTLEGGDGDDFLADGDDFPSRDDATPSFTRSGGNDVFRGGSGNDSLLGLAGDDQLFGEEDDDSLLGGEGNDTLEGGKGNDVLSGVERFLSKGNKDVLTGSSGADEFQLGDEVLVYYDDQNDSTSGIEDFARITDFNPNEGDIIQLHGSAGDYSLKFITPTSTEIYLGEQNVNQPAELIAIAEGINLDLAADYIHYADSNTVNSRLVQNTSFLTTTFNPADSIVPTVVLSQSSQAANTSKQAEDTIEDITSALVSSKKGSDATTILSQPEELGLAFDLTKNNNSEQLLNNLLGDRTGLSEFKTELIGDGRAFGTFENDPFGLGAGIAISTGRVTDLAGANTKDGGFTALGPADEDVSQDFAEAGAVGDSISLKIEFNADATKEFLFFQYVFGSEEFAEFGGSLFNDNFSLTLNGFNFARLTDDSTVSINNLVPSPLGPYHPDFIYNPAPTGATGGATKLDGYTKPQLFQAPLVQNGRNTLIINVQDVNDGVFDSAVFIKGKTLGTKLPADVPPDGGAPPDGGVPPGENPIPGNDNILTIPGTSAQTSPSLFTLTGTDATFINEVGVFKVNDDKGGLDLDNDGITDLLPGDRDYTQAVLEQGKVIFSALPQGGIPNATRVLDFKGGDRLAFYLVQNSSTDEVLRDTTSASKVLFGSTFGKGTQQLQIEQATLADPLTLKWEDGTNGGDRDFNDMVLTMESTDQASSKGTRLQGKPQGELLDLRGVDLNHDSQADSVIQGSFSVNSEAANDNFVGFYRVDNTNGLVGNLLPNDQGYAAAAIKRSVVSFDRKGVDSVQLSGEQLGLLAPYIIDTGTPEQFLKKNSNNQPDKGPLAYFNYLGANPDQRDHIRLLADNAFGFEDSLVRLNFDFNDRVVQGHLLAAV